MDNFSKSMKLVKNVHHTWRTLFLLTYVTICHEALREPTCTYSTLLQFLKHFYFYFFYFVKFQVFDLTLY